MAHRSSDPPEADPQLMYGPVPARERADAARNRDRILRAAERLAAAHGFDNVTMDDVCAAAGVGKGTLFRRFGDKAGLAMAMLGDREARLQEAAIRGDPPLGRGAPPEERLRAFLLGLLGLLEEHTDLHLQSEADGARYRSGRYAFYRHHVALLLRQAGSGRDVDWFADLLLAPLDAQLYAHQRRSGMSAERISSGVLALVDAVLARA